MSSALREYLKNGGSYDELFEKYQIKVSRHRLYNNLVHFKYLHNGIDFSNAYIQECRGIVLDENNDFNCVARPFSKFWNYGDPRAATIDWASARVQEKLDGSLITLYYYADDWQVATTGTPDGRGEVHDSGMTFHDLVKDTMSKMGFTPNMQHLSYIFELTSPYNRIVVEHKESKLTLLAVRNSVYGNYVDPMDCMFKPLRCPPVVREFPLRNFDEICESFNQISGVEQEGYVVVDKYWNRVKIKHPMYVAAHHSVFLLDEEGMLNLILAGEMPEIIASLPELSVKFHTLKIRLVNFYNAVSDEYDRYQHIESQKDFAEAVKDSPFRAFLFAMRKGTDLAAITKKFNTRKLLALMEKA